MTGYSFASQLPELPGSTVAEIAKDFGTPVWVYDADRIRAQVERLRRFDVIRFAQKAIFRPPKASISWNSPCSP